MSTQSFVTSALRLLGFWVWASTAHAAVGMSAAPDLALRTGLVGLAVGAVLVLGAPWIAALMAPKGPMEPASPSAARSDDWLRIGSAVLGVWFVARSAFGFVECAFADPARRGVFVASAATMLAAGLVLFLGARGFAWLFARSRTLGIRPAVDGPSEPIALQAVAFSVVGLGLVASSVISGVQALAVGRALGLWGSAVGLAIGLLLFTGSTKLSALWSKLQSPALAEPEPEPEPKGDRRPATDAT